MSDSEPFGATSLRPIPAADKMIDRSGWVWRAIVDLMRLPPEQLGVNPGTMNLFEKPLLDQLIDDSGRNDMEFGIRDIYADDAPSTDQAAEEEDDLEQAASVRRKARKKSSMSATKPLNENPPAPDIPNYSGGY